MNNGEDEIEELANRFVMALCQGMGQRSLFALRTALNAAETEGIAGAVTMYVPAKCKDRTEVSFTIGTVDIVTRWASA